MKTSLSGTFTFLSVGAIAYLIGSSPWGVKPPVIPADSRAAEVPPWPIFRVGVALSDFFRGLADAITPPHVRVRMLATAHWDSNVLFALTKRRVFDMFDADTKLANCTDIAQKAKLYEEYTCRYMRAAASLGLFDELPDKMFRLTSVGEILREDHPRTQLHLVEFIKFFASASEKASERSLETGSSGFKEVHGMELFEFMAQESNKVMAETFDNNMVDLAKSTAGAMAVEWAPPKPNATFCDIGGGLGTLVVEMAAYYPQLRGMVFDLPAVAGRAKKYVAAHNTSDRIRVASGSFFDDLPKALEDCDVFVLRHVLQSWGDDACVQILQNIMKVARKGSKVMAVNFLIDNRSPFRKAINKGDVNLITLWGGGRQRTKEEYVRLFEDAGVPLDGHKIYPMREINSIVEFEV